MAHSKMNSVESITLVIVSNNKTEIPVLLYEG